LQTYPRVTTMLPLSTMVTGDMEDPVQGLPYAAVVASQWEFDAGSLHLWRYSANFLYRLTINGVPHFLRVAPASERTPERLEQEVALLDWLQATGQHVPTAVPAHNGDRVATTSAGGQTYLAVMWAEVPGTLREIDDLSLDDLALWGASLAQLHTALRRVPPAIGPERVAWHAERDLIIAALPAWTAEIQGIAGQSLEWIASLPTRGDDYGLIHGDFELDNLPWGDEGPGVIDFDEAGISWATADIAFAVRDLVEAGEDVTSPRLAAFLSGYAGERPLPAGLAEDLSRFNQWARLTTLARITHARAEDDSRFPDWAQSLNQRLGELAAEVRASILTTASSPAT
jgi:Ser/Thr protein kinase RdoA (MazF antagonist)